MAIEEAPPFDAWRDSSGVLNVAGEIDETTVAGFRGMLLNAVSRAPVTLDLSGVTYLPSPALSAIVAAMREPAAHPLTVRAWAGGIAAQVLELSGLPYEPVPPDGDDSGG